METTLINRPAPQKYSGKSLVALHYQGNDWKRLLDFYAAELKMLISRIEITRFMDFNISNEEAERYQNVLNMLNKKIVELRHDIQADEEKVQKLAHENVCNIKKYMLASDNRKLSRIKDISTSIGTLQFSINQFLAKNL